MRKGQVGDWLNYFNPTLSKRFDDCVRENLKPEVAFNYGMSADDQHRIHEFYSKKTST
jgi:hypothetical protein